MIDKNLLEILVCPRCKGKLDYKENESKLFCHTCRLKYAVKNGIPVMLIDEAEGI